MVSACTCQVGWRTWPTPVRSAAANNYPATEYGQFLSPDGRRVLTWDVKWDRVDTDSYGPSQYTEFCRMRSLRVHCDTGGIWRSLTCLQHRVGRRARKKEQAERYVRMKKPPYLSLFDNEHV
ncbi:hypothetical protein KSF_065240 [Reticulibacter mediterranei]|uniref:Uncharacterized protein n=1 Tax=Reticulibacter mediterranei TaxID=2778369 RepID=A0A8J3IL22_9CHLR|nr:hypothetical protein KSF_065240 [Reticulibacter mediterranei]